MESDGQSQRSDAVSGFGQHERTKGKTDVWLTPLPIIEALGKFELDPCGESHWPTANEIYQTDGLEKDWYGRVWLNPPYSEVGKWTKKLAEHGNGITLVFVRSDVGWFQDAINSCDAVLFLKGRIFFHHHDGTRAKGSAGAPSCLIAFGSENVKALQNSGLTGIIWIKESGE
jgi:hypothetical protein